MTVDELQTIVFEALARYRDELPLNRRAGDGGYPFFVGTVGGKTLVYGGADQPVFLIDVTQGELR